MSPKERDTPDGEGGTAQAFDEPRKGGSAEAVVRKKTVSKLSERKRKNERFLILKEGGGRGQRRLQIASSF